MAEPTPFSSSGFFDEPAIAQVHRVQPGAMSSGGSFGPMPVRQIYEALVVPVNWQTGMTERLEWLTDTQTAYDGTESRISLREFPRRSLEYGFGASGRTRQRLDSFLYGRGAKPFASPIWPDGMDLETDLAPGDAEIPVSTAYRDFAAGALVFLVGDDGSFEASEIRTVNADSLELAQAVARAWPAGARIYPGRIARLPDSQAVDRFTGDHVTGRIRVAFENSGSWPLAVEATTYRDMPVMTEPPDWSGGVDADLIRKLSALDFSTGVRSFEDESGLPEIVQSMRWFMESRQRLAAFRSWLYTRAGKFRAVWVPTWVPDLTMISGLTSGGVSFDIENIGYARQIARGVHRRDIRIELHSGAVYFRRITGAAAIDADTETLTINAALGVAVAPAAVSRISYMALSRMDSDGVEISYFTGEAAQAVANMRATGNDL